MNDKNIFDKPQILSILQRKCEEIGFTMPSDQYIGSLLKTLVASKPGGNFLELGSGIGLSLAWILDGMDADSSLISIDNDRMLIDIVQEHLGQDHRVNIVCGDGAEWINSYKGNKFDLVFADTWPGKFRELDQVLDLIAVGGFYIIDDLLEATDWPEGHAEKVQNLIQYLEYRADLNLTKMSWSTGIIVATKILVVDTSEPLLEFNG